MGPNRAKWDYKQGYRAHQCQGRLRWVNQGGTGLKGVDKGKTGLGVAHGKTWLIGVQ